MLGDEGDVLLVGRPHHVLDHGHHNLGQSLALHRGKRLVHIRS